VGPIGHTLCQQIFGERFVDARIKAAASRPCALSIASTALPAITAAASGRAASHTLAAEKCAQAPEYLRAQFSASGKTPLKAKDAPASSALTVTIEPHDEQ